MLSRSSTSRSRATDRSASIGAAAGTPGSQLDGRPASTACRRSRAGCLGAVKGGLGELGPAASVFPCQGSGTSKQLVRLGRYLAGDGIQAGTAAARASCMDPRAAAHKCRTHGSRNLQPSRCYPPAVAADPMSPTPTLVAHCRRRSHSQVERALALRPQCLKNRILPPHEDDAPC